MDTVILRLRCDDVGGIDLRSYVSQFLTDRGEHRYKEGTSITGRCGHMKVSASGHSLKIENSLSKYHLGSNFHTLEREQVREAIESLGDDLHLPIERASVQRFDYPRDLLLDYPVELYLPYLGQLGRSKRLEGPHSLLYRSAGGELSLYDKVAEMRGRNELIPIQYRGANVLRIEARYMQRAAAYFKRTSILASDLYEEGFFGEVREDWQKQYKSIQKLNEIKPDLSRVKTIRDYQTAAVAFFVQSLGGELAALNDVAERQKKLELTKKQASDQRKEIRRCSTSSLQTSKSKLLEELDRKTRSTRI